jgi:ribonuclease P protein component
MATAQVQPPRPLPARLCTLKRRTEFLNARQGARFATPLFVLEARQRNGVGDKTRAAGPRFGFTVSKQVGTAVERNRIKRRLKAAVRDVVRDQSRGDFDYVVIARRAALDASFADLVSNLVAGLARVHRAPKGARKRETAPDRTVKSET